ncbi:flagellin [Salinibacter ruber]|uniref:Flagellin n=1 Tax=Salinibacter ruber TaxID=146919 RepID=A0A9X2ZBC4_9BACT|nr:flagellin [Salinibacter ruber]MCS3613883.1 flagellin [Salinibacter ruber]MCS3673504.1 flagellin [Salinibacter ruber]MCS4036114.1 flagellin [Salinibacter ruber]
MSSFSQINTNIQAQRAFQNLSETSEELQTRQERLTTGLRINSAEDDAAGFEIANQLEAKTGGQGQALRNIGDAKSTLSTAEGALDSQLSILQTAKEKATQAANGSLSNSEQEAIQNELNQLTGEIQDIAENTEFNGKSLIDGGESGGESREFSFQTGEGAKDQFDVSLANTQATSSNGLDIGQNAADVTNPDNVEVDSGDFASLSANVQDGTDASLSSNITNSDGELENLSGGEFNLTVKRTGTDEFEVSVNGDTGATSTITTATNGTSVVVGGDGSTGTTADEGDITLEKDTASGDQLEVSLVGTEKSQLTDVTGGTGSDDPTGEFSVQVGGDGVKFADDVTESDSDQSDTDSLDGAQEAINTIDDAIDTVTSELSNLGATQNRLSFKESNLTTTRTNLNAAQSRIEDADFAREQTQVAKLQVQQQSGTAQLAQANAAGQSVLSLLQ